MLPRKKFFFRYTEYEGVLYPLIPVRFRNGDVETPIILSILDSGSDNTTISKPIAEFLSLEIGEWEESQSAGGPFLTCRSKVTMIIGRGGRIEAFENVEIRVTPSDTHPPIPLMGRNPIFDNYDITFSSTKKAVILEPKRE
jgi:hypothetical protein